jgi:hypothetical protein
MTYERWLEALPLVVKPADELLFPAPPPVDRDQLDPGALAELDGATRDGRCPECDGPLVPSNACGRQYARRYCSVRCRTRASNRRQAAARTAA